MTIHRQPDPAPEALEDCITIIAATGAEAMRAARERGLNALGYVIVGPVVRHTFAVAGAGDALFEGVPMAAATWVRKTPAADGGRPVA